MAASCMTTMMSFDTLPPNPSLGVLIILNSAVRHLSTYSTTISEEETAMQEYNCISSIYIFIKSGRIEGRIVRLESSRSLPPAKSFPIWWIEEKQCTMFRLIGRHSRPWGLSISFCKWKKHHLANLICVHKSPPPHTHTIPIMYGAPPWTS